MIEIEVFGIRDEYQQVSVVAAELVVVQLLTKPWGKCTKN